jgi:HEAT repeat protein
MAFLNCPITLSASLMSKEREVREAAAFALARLGERAHDAVEPLTKALADESEKVRENALNALVRIGDAAVPALRNAAQSAEENLIRLGSQRALSLMGQG